MKVLNPDGGRGPWRPGGPDGAFMTLCYFIHERERIRLRRESGTPGPWTKDPILRDAFFTNVDRRSDFGTRWFVDNVYAHRKDDIDLVRRILTCRLINRIDVQAYLPPRVGLESGSCAGLVGGTAAHMQQFSLRSEEKLR